VKLPESSVGPDGGFVVVAPVVFDEVYSRLYPSMVRLAFVLSGSHPAAEDVAQEAFLAAYKKWDQLAVLENPDGWIRRVVVNKAHSRLRRVYAEGRARVRWAGGRSFSVELPYQTEAFWREVRSLPRRQAQALVLYYSEGYSTAEISETLGCGEATVRVHLHRGRLALANGLGTDGYS
jgi:RNA polymerase sigma-70 factor (ECF subfamily)